MSLFGSAATSKTPLFGTAPAASTAVAKPLFGSTTTTSSPKPLFGAATSSTAAPATSSVPLFGTSTAPSTTTTASGGLFGSTTAATTSSTAGGTGLFGSKPASGAAPTLGGGLFGSTPAAATTAAASTTPSLGLGGVQHNQAVASASGTTTTSLTSGTDKDTTKDAEVHATMIREMLPAIEERLRKNRELIEEVENSPAATDSLSIDEILDKTRGWIGEVRRNVRNASEASKNVALLAAHDKALLETAKRVQEQAVTANQTTHSSFIKKHLTDRTAIYDLEMRALQTRVNDLRVKFEKLLNGEPSLTMAELDEYFQRCDKNAASAQHHIHEVGREIEELKNLLIEQGYTHLRKTYTTAQPVYSDGSLNNEGGAEFFPSHTSLAMIGSSLRAPATAAPVTVGGLGLGTGSSLFGSNTGGSSLFGSTTTAAKPAFSGGSLFGNLSSTAATSSTTTATTSSTSLFGAKPTTTTNTVPTFGSTLSNNSSGTLFTSKK